MTTTLVETDFAALLCSRICHDLVSPIGALTNGLELLEEDSDANLGSQVTALISQSAITASDKLQFFRLAFGSGGGFSHELDMREAERAALSLMATSRATIMWRSELAYAPKPVVKLALNMALVGAECLIRGGQLNVNVALTDENYSIDLLVEGDRLIISPLLGDCFSEQSLDVTLLDSRTVPLFLIKRLMVETMASAYFRQTNETNVAFGVSV